MSVINVQNTRPTLKIKLKSYQGAGHIGQGIDNSSWEKINDHFPEISSLGQSGTRPFKCISFMSVIVTALTTADFSQE